MQWHPAASLAPLQLLVQVDLLITISMEKDKLKISLKPFFCKEDTNNEMADILGEFNINSKTEKRRKEKISDTKTEMKSVKVAAKPGKGELLTTLPGEVAVKWLAGCSGRSSFSHGKPTTKGEMGSWCDDVHIVFGVTQYGGGELSRWLVGGEGQLMEEVRSKYSMWASHYNKRRIRQKYVAPGISIKASP
ncbi:hypothetical protein NC651_019325 [Populus alba x Populus x berolinensis]|nr:hypothetical protein NC651_019325 [Populus alba x Populus x berolinensis]